VAPGVSGGLAIGLDERGCHLVMLNFR
jgi:hypothetical protein